MAGFFVLAGDQLSECRFTYLACAKQSDHGKIA